MPPAQPSNPQRDAHIQFIRDYANRIGVNPDLALGIANALTSPHASRTLRKP
jgi:hypothetical protein